MTGNNRKNSNSRGHYAGNRWIEQLLSHVVIAIERLEKMGEKQEKTNAEQRRFNEEQMKFNEEVRRYMKRNDMHWEVQHKVNQKLLNVLDEIKDKLDRLYP